jgi:glucose-6-phosphate 1-dehydrogenase
MNSPFVMVVFGATGDLMRNKLLPALFSLFKKKQLGIEFFIIGFARRPFTDDSFRKMLKESVKNKNSILVKNFLDNIYYQQGLFDDKKGYNQLIKKLNTFDKKLGACITRLFYLATPPDNYEIILDFLRNTKLSEGCGQGSSKWTRIIIEKPFGKDLDTARLLDKKLGNIFDEKQIFRVDHYLGKETVQNMVAFRFANKVFEPVWNKNYIDHIQITWAEERGVGVHGKFFDGVGLLRDVGQNHLMQLIAGVAMEEPKSFTKEFLRNERYMVIKAIRSIAKIDVSKFVVRGQYKSYIKEKDVPQDSNTETFVAMKLFIDTPRFKGVPFYVRAGKNLQRDVVEISIVFIQSSNVLFKEYGFPKIGNVLTIRIQPDEGISIRILAKKPGTKLALKTVNMHFTYQEAFQTKGTEAYEKILVDIFAGDQMLFNRSDELSSSWEFITNILEGWSQEKSKVLKYIPGTWGPKEADELIEKDGRKWL